jgi:hypothetical protein
MIMLKKWTAPIYLWCLSKFTQSEEASSALIMFCGLFGVNGIQLKREWFFLIFHKSADNMFLDSLINQKLEEMRRKAIT